MKAFHARVLRRLPRLNVQQLDPPLDTPCQKMPARQFRPVVATDRQRLPAFRHNRIQHSRHSPTGKAGVHFQSQTLPRVGIHHAQHPDRPSALHRIVYKIQCPLLIRRSPRQQRLSLAHAMLPLLPPNHQPGFPIHPMHPLVVHLFSRSRRSNTCSRRYPKRGFDRASSTNCVRNGSSLRVVR